MASSPLESKSYHTRSVSLPSRSHPLIPQFSEHLCRLRASEATSLSLSSISNRLSGLGDLYECVDHLLLLPHIQQTLSQECHEKWVDDVLDGYLRLLDACATTKDIYSQTKEDVKEQLSILRRKKDASNFAGFLTSRKKGKKPIEKLVKDLKRIGNNDVLLALDKNYEIVAIVGKLKEVEAVTLEVLESLLSYTAGTKVQSKLSGWSLVSKLMQNKNAACQAEETVMSEFEKLDAVVHMVLIGHKSRRSDDNKNIVTVQGLLGELELNIEGLEDVLERLLRRLIKTRVSLLNILIHSYIEKAYTQNVNDKYT